MTPSNKEQLKKLVNLLENKKNTNRYNPGGVSAAIESLSRMRGDIQRIPKREEPMQTKKEDVLFLEKYLKSLKEKIVGLEETDKTLTEAISSIEKIVSSKGNGADYEIQDSKLRIRKPNGEWGEWITINRPPSPAAMAGPIRTINVSAGNGISVTTESDGLTKKISLAGSVTVPAGGTVSQTIMKNSSADGDVSWTDTVLNVKAYGALGDGATDDASVIQQAIDDCPQGGVVFFPPGTYMISVPLVMKPNMSIRGSHWRRVVGLSDIEPTSGIKIMSSFSGVAAIRMLDQEVGGYSADSCGQQIYDISILGEDAPGTTGGISALGKIHDVVLQNVTIWKVPGTGVHFGNYTRVDTSVVHPYTLTFTNVTSKNCGSFGFYFQGCTDSTFVHCEALGSGDTGFKMNTMANSSFFGCRSEWSDGHGYYLTGNWLTGTGAGGATFVGCTTDRNDLDGFHVDATGSGTISFTGCMTRRDGRNGASGGGGYAGIRVNAPTTPIIIDNCSCYPGVDDGGTGTNSPDYGISMNGATWVSLVGGYYHAQVDGIYDAGTNTVYRRGMNIGEASGSTAAPTRSHYNPWNTTGEGTIWANQADFIALTLQNTSTNTNLPLIDVIQTATSDRVLSAQVSGDSTRRFNLKNDGTMEWGSGSASRDTNLYRSAADTLKTDDSLVVVGAQGTITRRPVEANTAVAASPNVLDGSETNKVLTNEGTTAKNYHTLPTASAGLVFTFIVQDSDGIRVVASGGDTIRLAATASGVAGYTESTTIGDSVTLVAINATEWIATSIIGTWTTV